MKKWILLWFLVISSLLVIGIFNFIVDPYQQYRKASFYKLPYKNPRELNAGLAKNFDFDSVVIGTSMMQNFNINDLHTILGYKKPIKLTMPGCSVYEQKIILTNALHHQKIKNVLIGIDFLSYYGDVKRFKHGEAFFPSYLYDDNLINKYKYLISSDTLKRSFQLLFSHNHDERIYDYTKMYEWKSHTKDEDVLSVIKKRWINRKNFDNEAQESEKKLLFLKNNFDYNLKSVIENNKNIKFTLFFPPYSILAYKVYEQRGELNDFIHFKEYVVKSLSKYKNVKIYDFEFANKITFNLQNYYDLYHYNKHISRWILEEIKENKYLVNLRVEKMDNKIFLKSIHGFKVEENCFK